MQTNQNPHRFAKIFGYVCSLLFPIIAIIIGIYLILSENKEVHKHGIVIIVIAIIVQLISMISMLA